VTAPRPDPVDLAGRLRQIAMAMAGALALLLGLVLFVAPEGTSGTSPTVSLVLAGAAVGMIVVGLVLAAAAAGGEPGPGGTTRLLASLALREGGGLLGVPLAFLGAGRAWSAALLGLSIASILALLPPRPAAR